MSVRTSTDADADGILELLEEFNSKTPMPALRQEVRVFLQAMMQDENSVVLVSDTGSINGVLIGTVVHNPIYDTIWLQEMVWYARDNSGVRLLSAFEQAGKRLGVSMVYMTALATTDERIDCLLNRRGYLQFERSYVKNL